MKISSPNRNDGKKKCVFLPARTDTQQGNCWTCKSDYWVL